MQTTLENITENVNKRFGNFWSNCIFHYSKLMFSLSAAPCIVHAWLLQLQRYP